MLYTITGFFLLGGGAKAERRRSEGGAKAERRRSEGGAKAEGRRSEGEANAEAEEMPNVIVTTMVMIVAGSGRCAIRRPVCKL